MIPYKANKITPKNSLKLKPIPSPQLINILTTLCQHTQNTYDRKNHILTIKNNQQYSGKLFQRFGRTPLSFEKQLKMLGFKKRKFEQDNQNEKDDKVIFSWRGKKQHLINNQLISLQANLNNRKHKTKYVKQQIKMQKKLIDDQIQCIIMSMMVNPSSQNAKQSLSKAINQTKKAVNSVQEQTRKVINEISYTLGNQLELYRLLIYKQDNINKKQLKLKDDEEQQYNEKNSEYQIQEQINDSQVSIQISQPRSHQIIKQQPVRKSQSK